MSNINNEKNCGPFKYKDVLVLKNILHDFEELEDYYYNKSKIVYPYYNKDNPFENNLLLRRAITSCIQTIFEQIIRLRKCDSYITKSITQEEFENIIDIRNDLSHEYSTFETDDANECVKYFMPIIKDKLENVIEQYNYLLKQQTTEQEDNDDGMRM